MNMKAELRVLIVGAALLNFAAGLFNPIYAAFVEEIGGDLLTAGSAYGAYALAAGVLILVISRWEDHVRHQEKLIFAGFLLNTLGFLGYFLIRTPFDLFVVQVIFGIGLAVLNPSFDGFYSRHLDRKKVTSGWGAWEATYWTVTAFSAIIGGYVAENYGFQFLFSVMFLISLASTATVAVLLLKNKKPLALFKVGLFND